MRTRLRVLGLLSMGSLSYNVLSADMNYIVTFSQRVVYKHSRKDFVDDNTSLRVWQVSSLKA